MITPPYHLTNLVNNEEVELKFTAPGKPGHYNFTVCVRSDSYLGKTLLPVGVSFRLNKKRGAHM